MRHFFFCPEGGGNISLRNVSKFVPYNPSLRSGVHYSSLAQPSEPLTL